MKICRHGMMLYNVHDKYVGRSLELYGEFSEGEVGIFDQIVKPGAWVLEIGANIGAHTIHLAKMVGPGGRVLAFEPQRLVFQTLCANVALNSLANVHTFQTAVSECPGEITVPVLDPARPHNFGGLNIEGHSRGEAVPVITVDSFSLPRCDVMKIDVEGMEGRVLTGAAGTIARFRPILYVENDRSEKSDALIRQIDSLGYNMYWHCPPLFNPRNFAGRTENVFGRIVSKNLFCWHKSVAQHVKGMTQVRVPA